MRIGRKKKSAIDRAHDYVESVADTVIPQLEAALEGAREKAGPALADARDRAVPLVHDARDRAVPLLHDARDRAVPVLAEGRVLAAEKAALAATLAAETAAAGRDLAAAKVAELRPEPEPQHRKLKVALLIGGLLAIGGAVFARLRRSQSSGDNWQSSYTPAPPAGSTAPSGSPVTSPLPTSGVAGDPLTDPIKTPLDPSTPTAVEAAESSDSAMTDPTHRTPVDDTGGGDPGEALSDAGEQPHEATTPDNPAEVVDVDEVPDSKRD